MSGANVPPRVPPQDSASNPAQAEQRRAAYGLAVVIAGFVVIFFLYLVTLGVFSSALPSSPPVGDAKAGATGTGSVSDQLSAVSSSIVAAMGAITGIIGSIVAAYFGIQQGASGKERSDAAAERSGAVAQAAMNKVPTNVDPREIAKDAQALLRVSPSTPPPGTGGGGSQPPGTGGGGSQPPGTGGGGSQPPGTGGGGSQPPGAGGSGSQPPGT